MRRVGLLGAAGLGIGIFVALLVVPLVFDRAVHSVRFEEFLARRVGGVFFSEARLEPLRWSGATAHSENLSLEGHEESPIAHVEAGSLRADWNWRALFSGTWRIEQITVDQVTSTLKNPGLAAAPPLARGDSVPFSTWLPSRFELGRIVIHRANLSYNGITANSVSLTATLQGDTWEIEGSGGMLTAPPLPPLGITSCRLRARDGIIFLQDATFRPPEGGRLHASGQSGRDALLCADWSGVPAGVVFGQKFGLSIAGTLEGESTHEATGRARGNFRLTNGSLRNIPLLNVVATLTGNPAFRQPALETFRADFDSDNGSLHLTHLVVASQGLARLEGQVTIGPGGALDGELQIGIARETLRRLPGARESVFTLERDGWFWASLHLGGTLANPSETLSSHLVAAITTGVLLDAGSEVIKKAPDTAVDTVKDMMNLFLPLVP